MKRNNWYKLDNAGQLFPMLFSLNNTNSFRLACILKEEVDPSLLFEAVKETLKRFPTFDVKLKKGYFWYYLEKNNKNPIIRKESPYICESNDFELQNGFPFNITYHEKRISIEIFHAISDGTGGMEFFKAIIFNYLTLKRHEIKNKGEVLTTQVETLLDESEDSFKFNYDNKIEQTKNESKAYKIKGTYYFKNWVGVIHVITELNSLKQASKKYNATITEYLSAVFLQSIYENYIKNNKTKRHVSLFIPVNARKYFSSKTLRNFALFIRTETKFKDNITFEEILAHIKETFNTELSKEKMLARIKTNMKLEKNPIVRITPLFIKKLIVKLVYKYIGSGANTMSFSNLGLVIMPDECSKHIDRFEFANGVSKETPINCTTVTYNDLCTISFTSCIIERKFQLFAIKKLMEDGVNLIIETNDLEVEHEKM